jgi:TRAP-type C4-dicarboxylate transport system substrate-binding protein
MKGKDLLKVFGSVCMVLFLLIAISTVYVDDLAEAAGPIEIRTITSLPQTFLAAQPAFKVMEKFNTRAKGEAVIKYLGGPEVFSGPDQAMAVKQGVVEMSQCIASYYSGLVPLANCFHLSRLTPAEERKNGAFAYLREMHLKADLQYLGRADSCPPDSHFFWIWTVPEVRTPKDFKGLRIGCPTPAANEFIKALGAVPKMIPIPEAYTAVQRKVIDGWWITFEDVVTSGLYEILPFCIDHPWYNDNETFIMNTKFWNKLPKHLQDLLVQCIIEVEDSWYFQVEEHWAKDRQAMLKAGMKFIKFSPSDAQWYVNTAYDSAWAEQIRKFPNEAPKLRQLFSK